MMTIAALHRLFRALCFAWIASTTATGFLVADANAGSNTRLAAHQHDEPQPPLPVGRRAWLSATLTAATSSAFLFPSPSHAAATSELSSGDILWITGKEPLRPGQKPRDKKDVAGTRKDPNFLRSLADCKNQCETSASGPDGLAKSKEDCLSDCQDVCCKTYQQCTFGIVPRI